VALRLPDWSPADLKTLVEGRTDYAGMARESNCRLRLEISASFPNATATQSKGISSCLGWRMEVRRIMRWVVGLGLSGDVFLDGGG